MRLTLSQVRHTHVLGGARQVFKNVFVRPSAYCALPDHA